MTNNDKYSQFTNGKVVYTCNGTHSISNHTVVSQPIVTLPTLLAMLVVVGIVVYVVLQF